jgi:succinate dehydrogenase / fumarate reductase cytochrome b subunit
MGSFLKNPVARKLITGVTGLGLALFVLIHMVGNLTYFSSDPDAYNKYSHTLASFGPLLYAVEIGLVVFFLFHAWLGLSIWLQKRRARPVDYDTYRSAGGPSRQTFSSRSMIVTGIIIFIFAVIHVTSFKYGPGMDAGYTVLVDGERIRDIKRLMEERFQSPVYAFGYVGVMILLAFHLRHGIWSALQSLGAVSPRLTPVVYTMGAVLGGLIAVGFFVLPLYIYFGGGA